MPFKVTIAKYWFKPAEVLRANFTVTLMKANCIRKIKYVSPLIPYWIDSMLNWFHPESTLVQIRAQKDTICVLLWIKNLFSAQDEFRKKFVWFWFRINMNPQSLISMMMKILQRDQISNNEFETSTFSSKNFFSKLNQKIFGIILNYFSFFIFFIFHFFKDLK